MSERVVVVLGAGASHDVDNGSTPHTNEAWKPPLASQLFDGTPSYAEIRFRHPGADRLAQIIAPRANAGALDIERELRSLSESPDPQTRSDFLDVPPYLRDLLYTVGLDPTTGWAGGDWEPKMGYVSRPGSYAHMIHQLLAEAQAQVAFVVLNYDRLLERALEQYDSTRYRFETFDSYAGPGQPVSVIKPHGSMDWWVAFAPTDARRSWHQAVRSQTLESLESSPTRVVKKGVSTSVGLELEVESSRYLAYPLITAPLAGKDASALVCPSQHLEALRQFMATCERYVFIGTSGFDGDVLGFLDEHMPTGSVAEFVGKGQEAVEARGRILDAVGKLSNRRDRKHDLVVDGFTGYLLSNRLFSFATLGKDALTRQLTSGPRV